MHLTRLSVTPIKGLGMHHPDSVHVDENGALGDRDFFCIDEEDRVISITRTGGWVGLRAEHDPGTGCLVVRDADGGSWAGEVRLGDPVGADFFGLREVPGRLVEGPWSAVLSDRAGQHLRLVRADRPGHGSDVHPVTFLNEASLDALAQAGDLASLDARRFRMLIAFAGTRAYEEDTWAGRTVRIGTAAFVVGGPVPRCAATTRDPDRGDPDLPVVKLLSRIRGVGESELGPGVMFGVYGRVTRPGRIAVGDPLRLD